MAANLRKYKPNEPLTIDEMEQLPFLKEFTRELRELMPAAIKYLSDIKFNNDRTYAKP